MKTNITYCETDAKGNLVVVFEQHNSVDPIYFKEARMPFDHYSAKTAGEMWHYLDTAHGAVLRQFDRMRRTPLQ